MIIHWIDKPTYISDKFISDISEYGDFKYYNDIPKESDLIERLNECDIAIVEWSRINSNVANKITRCKYIILVTTSYDYVDVDAINKMEIKISNCPEYSSTSVAEWTFSALMALNRKIILSHYEALKGYSHIYTPFLGEELHGKTLGLIGTGNIGKKVAEIGNAYGMNVIGYNKSKKSTHNIKFSNLDELFEQSHFITIQLPNRDDTNSLINKEHFNKIRNSICLVSCSRHNIINMSALENAINMCLINGLALDDVPQPISHVLRRFKNAYYSTGIAWYTKRSRENNLAYIIKMVHFYCTSNPLYILNNS